MEWYYILVVVLFMLAASDLMVGVANDAVNFTNSAIGSHAASRRVIMTVASIGILTGTLFSSGMMEIARAGVFHPQMFVLAEVMTIFLAVMFTDVLLLDLYNTFGLPTSTTVSLVFELLGAAIAVAAMKILNAGASLSMLGDYINSDKALAMMASILISVVLAFFIGMLIQFVSRLLFTFDYQGALRRVGAIWCALAMSFIIYYILIKGIKSATFLSADVHSWIAAHSGLLMLLNIGAWLVIFQLLLWFTRVNILKVIVLMGTFALAMAFAANDLVNFIGVAMAGLASYELALESGNLAMTMEGLQAPVAANMLILGAASIIMIATLWMSRKSRNVTRTEVDLARQSQGVERFESSLVSRVIVEMAGTVARLLRRLIPGRLQGWITGRFDTRHHREMAMPPADRPSFDLVRAAVNLMVASSLISFGTSLKLPLSTTYVTFMVAMGSSLADRAWGWESAAFRVNGVLTVIGGWFFTALLAFTVALLFAILIHFGGIYAIVMLIILSALFLYRTHRHHRTTGTAR